ncbi:DNA polymerase-3 subunit epsilon [Methylohalomonas lacus]|uniref:DNA polymerase III subunit epsilon n=1 Tax=Methylohalomonas lacus TaxID=398773 RepID=A0AAE3HJH0_9GAMM|nr:DNA polymerase III subunit epsilon [Methylohalomonas lacus]MCS3903514.1 DNA polymerase-3 subunit epsilon [Methylohalomonas lacus]
MRQVVLDTETTGLEPSQGHRIIEIGCVELRNRRQTQRQFHQYINPERQIDEGAFDVHGIGNDFLADKPRFSDIANDFIDFVRDAELIIHNAPFDVAFINAELERLGKAWGCIEDYCTVTDTLDMARKTYPGKRNSLDELCKRLEVDNSQRQLHGALLDAEILLDVYLTMTSGQEDLTLVAGGHRRIDASELLGGGERPQVTPVRVPEAELEAHERRLDELDEKCGGVCVWRRTPDQTPDTA